jgi:hypothetical protein
VTVAGAAGDETMSFRSNSNAVSGIIWMFSSTRVAIGINIPVGDGVVTSGTPAHNNGFFIGTRVNATADSTMVFDSNSPSGDGPFGPSGDTAAAPGSVNMAILADYNGIGAQNFFTGTLGAAGICSGFTQTQMTNIASDINSYMTARGKNVY